MKLLKYSLLFVSSLGILLAAPASADKSSEVRLKIIDDKNGIVSLNAIVKPNDGMVINHDGPWKLVLKDVTGLSFSLSIFEKKDFDDAVPGFKLSGKWNDAKTQNGSIGYEYTVFVCTSSKDKCFRDVHKGALGVKRRS